MTSTNIFLTVLIITLVLILTTLIYYGHIAESL